MEGDSVPGAPAIRTVDVPMFGMDGVNSPYILDAPEPAIVDTGPADGVDAVLEALDGTGIDRSEIAYIIPTHAHLDHAGGAGYLAEVCENATVVCHENAVAYLTEPGKLSHLVESVERAIGMAAPYGEPTVLDRERCLVVSGGERLDLGDRRLDIIDAPGHAPHQLCLFDSAASVLFAADANGMRFGPGDHRPTTPPPDFDLEGSLDTIERLQAFDPETVLYAHFGPGEAGEGMNELAAYAEMLPRYVGEIERARTAVKSNDTGKAAGEVTRPGCRGEEISAIADRLDDEWTHWSLETDIAGICRYLDIRA